MSEEQKREELTQEELESLQGEELPQREALSVLRVPFLGAAPIESAEPVPDEPELPGE